MADQVSTDQQPAISPDRVKLEKTVKQQVMLSIGLKFAEKDQLIRKLPQLSDQQLRDLQEVFQEENQRKQDMLTKFFKEHPELYPEFERFSKDHVSHIYRNVEEKQRGNEVDRMQELLTTNF